MEDHHLIGLADECFPGKFHPALGKGGGVNASGDIELAAVIGRDRGVTGVGSSVYVPADSQIAKIAVSPEAIIARFISPSQLLSPDHKLCSLN